MTPDELRAHGVLVLDMLKRGVDPSHDADRERLFEAVAGVLAAFGEHLAERESATAVELDFTELRTCSMDEWVRLTSVADIHHPEATLKQPEANE